MWPLSILVILSINALPRVPAQHAHTQPCEGCAAYERLQLELDDLRQELLTVKQELQYWQNSTLSILMKHTLNEPGSCANLCATKLDELEKSVRLHSSQQAEHHEEIMGAIASVNYIQNGAFHSPAASCKQLKAAHPASPSGEYWIQSPESGYASQQYCDMTRADCGGARGWMRIAYLNMDNPTHHCPSGFREITSPVRACGRRSGPGCVSVTFSTFGTKYRRVTGKVIGYQDKTTNAFYAYYNNRDITLDGAYVDGVSITHGQPRKHIWTFVAAVDEVRSNEEACPCTISAVTYTGVVPPFVGNDYFCETASRYQVQYIFYDEDPLWDKEGCGDGSKCCRGSSFFCKELEQATSDDIELRLCCDADPMTDEDAPLRHIELYIQ